MVLFSRLLQFLPVRLMQWQNVASVADQLNRTAIEEVHVEIETIKHRLTSLEEKKQLLDQVIERGKQLKAVKEANVKYFIDWYVSLSSFLFTYPFVEK